VACVVGRRPLRRPFLVAAAALAAGAVTTGTGGAPARADVIIQIIPSVTAGITSNANAASAPELRQRDEFGTAGVSATVRYARARTTYSLGYLLAYTRFFEGHGPTTITNAVTLSSQLSLTGALDLGFGATIGFSRTSGVVATSDLTMPIPQAAVGGTSEFLSLGASQNLSYRPSAKRTFTEGLGVSQLRYINAARALPTTTVFSFQGRGTQTFGRDSGYVDMQLFDVYNQFAVVADRFAEAHTFTVRLVAGWARELSAMWAASLDAGPMMVFKLTGPLVIAPSGSASLTYTRRPWFASLTLSQIPAVNLFFGDTTINDQAVVRMGLPLNRAESIFVTGFAAYVYARIASTIGSVGGKAFDQQTAGFALGARPMRLPIAASLQYLFLNQDSGGVAGRPVSNLASHTLMLTVGGILAFGKGTPPLFGGGPQ
jgi:hypothetical protein